MKIGIYSPYLDTLTGGEKYIFTMASCLSSEHEVVIFWDDREILEKASRKFDLKLSKIIIKPDIFKKGSLINRYVKTLGFDRFIFLSDGSIPILGAKKTIIHFQFPVEWINNKSISFLLRKRFISKIICNSNFTKDYIDRKFNTQSFVLYPPADISNKSNFHKKNTILTVGRFNPTASGTDFKKLDEMISAFKLFQKKRLKGWELKIITSVNESDEGNFMKFLSKINSKSIKVFKNAGIDEIKLLYGEAKIYWHAAGFGEDLNTHPERAEHFGISTVEAMSYGAVPIVIKAGGQKEIVRHHDNGFLWETLDELINYTHKVAVDNNLRESISEKALETSKKFSKERFCDELNHLIW